MHKNNLYDMNRQFEIQEILPKLVQLDVKVLGVEGLSYEPSSTLGSLGEMNGSFFFLESTWKCG